MRRADFFLVEAVRALRNNLATTVAATVTVLIVLYFLGVFVLFGTYLYAKVDKERSGVRVTVYLDKRASDAADQERSARACAQNPDVKPNAVEYVSKAEAWQRLKERVPKSVWESVLTNPLPASWEASLANPSRAKDVAASVRGMPGAEKGPNGVKYGGKDADRLLRNAAVVEAVIGGLILDTRDLGRRADSQHHPALDLRAPARGRGDEARRALRTGSCACRSCSRACSAAWAEPCSRSRLLGVSLVLLKDHLPAASLNEDGAHAIAFWLLAPLLLLAGTLLGAIGSGVTMRRFLRV